MPLADHQIEVLARTQNLITPFIDHKTDNPSKGLSSYGYDLTLGTDFVKYFSGSLIDTANPTWNSISSYTFESYPHSIILEPKQFILGHTVEVVKMPPNLIAKICDKSSLARAGIDVKNTVIEPGFEGQITLEITNNNNCPVKLHVNKGIAQIIFFDGDICRNPYNEKSKYQHQRGVTLPR